MAREQFIDKAFRQKSLDLIDRCDRIIREYRAQGFVLTLRQLYYQLVSRDIIENTQKSYKSLGGIVNDARLAGLLDWSGIEDRTRNLKTSPTWEDPESILDAVAKQYQEDPWLEQDYAVEVWVEKDALVGVIEPVCRRLRVPFFACRGYASQSEIYSAGKRLAGYQDAGRTPVVFHLGDHDPSGIDMTRDNTDRLSMFAREEIEVVRLALNMDQIREHNPPPNPAKDTDSRFIDYQVLHGDESWELDALEPRVIERLIAEAVQERVDPDRWQQSMDQETERRDTLAGVRDNFEDVMSFLRDRGDVV